MDPFSAGGYLRLSREKAHKSALVVASEMVRLPAAIRQASVAEINALAGRLTEAESNRALLTGPQASLVAQVVPFDPGLYGALARRSMGPAR